MRSVLGFAGLIITLPVGLGPNRQAPTRNAGDSLLLIQVQSIDIGYYFPVDWSSSGYEIRLVDDKTLLPLIHAEPVHLTVARPDPIFPVVDASIPGPVHYYRYVTVPDCVGSIDSDGDRLSDCVETNTGVFVSTHETGTDPMNPDSDNDAIDDGDEVLGTIEGLDLPRFGANPLRRDVFVEYDWCVDDVGCAHSHFPDADVLGVVYGAFANAPAQNPDGSTGITIHQDNGTDAYMHDGNAIDSGPDGDISGGLDGEFLDLKAMHFDPRRQGYFHYQIHSHSFDRSGSGLAEYPGNDSLVSLACVGTTLRTSGIIVHELGHNFWLHHGGFEALNHKPNYNSVMNYWFALSGVDSDCDRIPNGVIDYSRGALPDLDENDLNESHGTCGTIPFDWDGDQMIETSVSFDISMDNSLDILRDSDDWTRVTHQGMRTDSDLAGRTIVTCEEIAAHIDP